MSIFIRFQSFHFQPMPTRAYSMDLRPMGSGRRRSPTGAVTGPTKKRTDAESCTRSHRRRKTVNHGGSPGRVAACEDSEMEGLKVGPQMKIDARSF